MEKNFTLESDLTQEQNFTKGPTPSPSFMEAEEGVGYLAIVGLHLEAELHGQVPRFSIHG